jgi:hypothetical protein
LSLRGRALATSETVSFVVMHTSGFNCVALAEVECAGPAQPHDAPRRQLMWRRLSGHVDRVDTATAASRTHRRTGPSHRKPLGRTGHVPIPDQQAPSGPLPPTSDAQNPHVTNLSEWLDERRERCTMGTNVSFREGTAAFGVEVIGVPSLRIWGRGASRPIGNGFA